MNYDPRNHDSYYRFDDEPYQEQKSNAPKILFIILIGVVTFFLLGTIIALASKKGTLGNKYRQEDPSPEKVVNRSLRSKSKLTTTSLGQLRIINQAEEGNSRGAIMCVSPWFSYPEDDVQLFEEIAQRDIQLKSLVSNYFSSKTKKQILSIGEKQVKEDLKNLINELLVLGDIENIYFEQYLFFDEKL